MPYIPSEFFAEPLYTISFSHTDPAYIFSPILSVYTAYSWYYLTVVLWLQYLPFWYRFYLKDHSPHTLLPNINKGNTFDANLYKLCLKILCQLNIFCNIIALFVTTLTTHHKHHILLHFPFKIYSKQMKWVLMTDANALLLYINLCYLWFEQCDQQCHLHAYLQSP